MAHFFAIFGLLALSAVNVAASGYSKARWQNLPQVGMHPLAEETSMVPCGGACLCMLGGREVPTTPVLDTAALRWRNGTGPPIDIHHFQAVTGPDGCAWIMGAWTGPFPAENAVKEIYRFCVDKNRWEVVGTIDRPRGASGVVFHEGYFYLVTGNVGGHRLEATAVRWFDRYDPWTKTWTVMPDIPHRKYPLQRTVP